MSADTESQFFHGDALGSITGITSAGGSKQWTYSYEPFGALRSETKHEPDALVNSIGFTGAYHDSATGLYHLRARQYDTSTGRFTATDPIAQSWTSPYVSSYVYAGDRPTVLIDPSGKGPVWPNACSGWRKELRCISDWASDRDSWSEMLDHAWEPVRWGAMIYACAEGGTAGMKVGGWFGAGLGCATGAIVLDYGAERAKQRLEEEGLIPPHDEESDPHEDGSVEP